IEAPGPTLTNGAFLARTLWLALDPFVCAPDAAAHDAVKPGDLVPAHGVGEVIESRHEVFGVGSLVLLECGLQQLCVSDGRHARLLHPGQTPASSALGVLGVPGMAAYFGLLDLARLRPGETVLVSAAANAAGAMAGQIAMLKGARAIGVAGSREKCDWVTRHARLSACINHGSENVGARLKQLAPRGVDIYFDSTGGEVLRVEPHDYEHRRGEFLRDAIAWHGAGRIAAKDDIVDGLVNAPAHLLLAMQGGNFGRPLIRI